MRSSNSKIQGKAETVNSSAPLENGISSKEEEEEMEQNVRELAAKVVEDVVKMASEAAQEKTSCHSSPAKSRGCGLQRLPTIQIDTVPSPPPSPTDLSPLEESNGDEPLDTSDIHLELETVEQEANSSEEDLKENLKSYVEDIVSQAMVLAEKKLQFTGLPDDVDVSEQFEPSHSISEPMEQSEKEIEVSEIRTAAEKVVDEVISKASETVVEKLENGTAGLSFPDLPSIQIDTVKSAPPSPESEEESPLPPKKWSFKIDEDSESEKTDLKTTEAALSLITFDEAPEDVQEAATTVVKEIVGKAIAMAEEKSTTPTVPFNFEDIDLMKNSGPWYIRAREALMRLLRTACFCTPRRSDS